MGDLVMQVVVTNFDMVYFFLVVIIAILIDLWIMQKKMLKLQQSNLAPQKEKLKAKQKDSN